MPAERTAGAGDPRQQCVPGAAVTGATQEGTQGHELHLVLPFLIQKTL